MKLLKVLFVISLLPIHSVYAKETLEGYQILLDETSYEYSKNTIEPYTYVVNDEENVLIQGEDYIVKYLNNKNVGTATVLVQGINDYKGVLKKTFTITKRDIRKCEVSLNKVSYEYDGKEKKPKVLIMDQGMSIPTSQYSITYKNNLKCGKASVSIKGKENYKYTITKPFIITPSKVTQLRFTADQHTIKCYFNIIPGVKGYQLLYNDQMKTVNKNTGVISINKLSNKTNYSIRMRAYMIVDEQIIYGQWSKVKSIKTK